MGYRRFSPHIITLVLALFTQQGQACQLHWPYWEAYANRFVQHDGRVIEHSQKSRTTSEAQAYALFHALVANDHQRFVQILSWAENNLAKGDLRRHLPAWSWGKNRHDQWQVLDENAATDADMWLAYTLLEASRLWHHPPYGKLGYAILKNIEQHEIAYIPTLGPVLLPGPIGFITENNQWKLNPSYLTLQLMRRFTDSGNKKLWEQVIKTSTQILLQTTQNGAAPDWVIYDIDKGFIADKKSSLISSYDAIRVPLWLGTLSDQDSIKKTLLEKFNLTKECRSKYWPPEKKYLETGQVEGLGPIGFKAALLPLLKTTNHNHCLKKLVKQINSSWNNNLLTDNPVYYDQNLALFGLAWLDGRYRFNANGYLTTLWEKSCHALPKESSVSASA